MAMESNEQRFRSFCERYVIARTPTFRVGHEEEDQWTCMLNAKSAYRRIEAMGRGISKEDEAMAFKAMEAGGTLAGAQSPPIEQQVKVRVPSVNLPPQPFKRWGQMQRFVADSKSWTGWYGQGGVFPHSEKTRKRK